MLNELQRSKKYAGDFERNCFQVSGCFVCGDNHDSGKCDFLHHLGPIVRVEDTRSLTYARLSLPTSLEVQDNMDGRSTVVARIEFAKGTQFGPFKARHLSELSYQTDFPVKVFRSLEKNNDDGWFLDTSDENTSNWMCLVSPATSSKNQNLTCYQDSCCIYYVAVKDIRRGEQLRVYYAPYYAVKLGKVPFKISCLDKSDVKTKMVNKLENHKEKDEEKKIYTEMLLNKEVAGKLAEQLPARKLGAPLAPERWQCKLCGVYETSVVQYAKHLMNHYKPLLTRSDKPRCHLCYQLLPTEKLLVKHKVEMHGLKLKRWCHTATDAQSKQEQRICSSGNISRGLDEIPCSAQEVLISSGETSGLCKQTLISSPQISSPSLEINDVSTQKSVPSLEVCASSPRAEECREDLTVSSRELSVSGQKMLVDAQDMSAPVVEACTSTHAMQIVACEEMHVSSTELHSSSQEAQTILLTALPDQLFNNQSLSALLQDGQSDAIKSFFAQYQEDVDRDVAMSCPVRVHHDSLTTHLTKASLSDFGLTSSDIFLQHDASSESNNRKNCEPTEPDLELLSHIPNKPDASLTNMIVSQLNSVPDVHIMIMTHSDNDRYDLDLQETRAEQLCDEPDEVVTDHAEGSTAVDVSFTQQKEALTLVPQCVLALQHEHSNKETENPAEDKAGNTVQHDGAELVALSLEGGPPYYCDICQKEFHTSEYIYRHLRKHTGEFTCISCRMVFARKENLVNHSCFTKPDSKLFSCSHCNKNFLLKKSLNRHMLKHNDAYACSDCQRVYSSEKALLSHHCGKSVRETGPYHCPICNREFLRRRNLNSHLPLHIECQPCMVCGKKLRAGDTVSTHEAFCTQGKVLDATGSTPCPRCTTVFTQLTSYRQHVYQHTHPVSCSVCGRRFNDHRLQKNHVCPGEMLCCDVCQEQFVTLPDLQSHQLSHGVPLFHCYECGFSFHNSESLLSCCHKASAVCATKKRRQDTETSASRDNTCAERLLVCQVCGETYKTAASLKSHLLLHGERKFECEVCHKRFFRKDVLQEHHAVHQEAQFPCPECNKLLKSKKSLDVHMLRHTGKKRFVCPKCPRTFYQKINLLKHSAIHESTASRQLKCQCCSKTFTSKEYLALHQLEHTQGRIFQCSMCDKNFVKKHLLKSHVKKYHGKQSYLCPYCNLTFFHWNSIRRHLESRRHSKQQQQCNAPNLISRQLIQNEVTNTEMLSVSDIPLQMAEVSDAAQGEGSDPSLGQPTTLLTEESAVPISTYILGEGAVIQPETSDGDILLYVLDTVPTADAFEELT